MNEIIREIEQAQLKETLDFHSELCYSITVVKNRWSSVAKGIKNILRKGEKHERNYQKH